MSDFTAMEHASGLRPLGEYRDHCYHCRIIHDCNHEDVLAEDIMSGGSVLRTLRFCSNCGIDPDADA